MLIVSTVDIFTFVSVVLLLASAMKLGKVVWSYMTEKFSVSLLLFSEFRKHNSCLSTFTISLSVLSVIPPLKMCKIRTVMIS